jgi:hypothetical protein
MVSVREAAGGPKPANSGSSCHSACKIDAFGPIRNQLLGAHRIERNYGLK